MLTAFASETETGWASFALFGRSVLGDLLSSWDFVVTFCAGWDGDGQDEVSSCCWFTNMDMKSDSTRRALQPLGARSLGELVRLELARLVRRNAGVGCGWEVGWCSCTC